MQDIILRNWRLRFYTDLFACMLIWQKIIIFLSIMHGQLYFLFFLILHFLYFHPSFLHLSIHFMHTLPRTVFAFFALKINLGISFPCDVLALTCMILKFFNRFSTLYLHSFLTPPCNPFIFWKEIISFLFYTIFHFCPVTIKLPYPGDFPSL